MVQSYPAICGISSGLRVMSRVVNLVVNRLPRPDGLAMTALLSHCEKRRDKAISQVAGLPRVDFVNPRNDKNM